MKWILFGSCLVITGCASSLFFPEFDPLSPEFNLASDIELCIYVGNQLPERAQAVVKLRERNVLSEFDWVSLNKRRVSIGNSECVVRAIWGDKYDSKQLASYNQYGDVQSEATYSCKLDGIDYCPYTTIKFVNGRVIKIEQSN